MAQIICNNLTVGYEKKAVVKDLFFTVKCGDYLCIIGENGAGKSTLVKSILGLVPTICGKTIFADGLTKKEIGYLPTANRCAKRFSSNGMGSRYEWLSKPMQIETVLQTA